MYCHVLALNHHKSYSHIILIDKKREQKWAGKIPNRQEALSELRRSLKAPCQAVFRKEEEKEYSSGG